jgi:DNA-binding NarL/FixJ family response regulator
VSITSAAEARASAAELVFARRAVEGLMMNHHQLGGRTRGRQLTPKEREVLSRVIRGASNKQIANDMACSVKTIEYHVSNLLRKSGTSTRLELVVSALS